MLNVAAKTARVRRRRQYFTIVARPQNDRIKYFRSFVRSVPAYQQAADNGSRFIRPDSTLICCTTDCATSPASPAASCTARSATSPLLIELMELLRKRWRRDDLQRLLTASVIQRR